LSAYRVLTKNLVYVVGLPQRVADGDTLKKSEFFGRFGKILRVAVGTSPATGNQPPSYTAYVTYDKDNDALRAIQVGMRKAIRLPYPYRYVHKWYDLGREQFGDRWPNAQSLFGHHQVLREVPGWSAVSQTGVCTGRADGSRGWKQQSITEQNKEA
jgi:hypothetical protein